jgi:LPPG:FO 2-phospho-L-lactate transferase
MSPLNMSPLNMVPSDIVPSEMASSEMASSEMAGRRVTALAGGVGAARMLRGLAAVVGQPEITAVINTGDDMVLHGLYISPDIDTVTYTLAGASNNETGWGLAGESWTVMEALRAFEGAKALHGAKLSWFGLGDRDLATHMFRTGRLAAGDTLSEVTADIAHRFGVAANLLPMANSRVETRVTVELRPVDREFGGLSLRDDAPRGRGEPGVERGPAAMPGLTEVPAPTEIGFQEYFVGLRHDVPVKAIRFAGVEAAEPAPGVLQAIENAEVVVICPSNPIVSIGPLLAVPGIASAVANRRDDVVAVSPIIAGRALKGPADRMLTELGHEASAVGVARMWAPLAGALVIDDADADLATDIEKEGMRCVVAPSVMSGPKEAAALASVVLGASAARRTSTGYTAPPGARP